MLDVIRVEAQAPYQLWLEFENREQRVFDLTPYLEIGVFRQLQDTRLFRAARVEGGTVVWPGDIDIAPETLYQESVQIGHSIT